MSLVFYMLGIIFGVIGGAWMAAILRNLPNKDAAILGALIAAAPGFGVLLSGLLLIAVGSVLAHLKHIERNTGDTADLLQRVLEDRRD